MSRVLNELGGGEPITIEVIFYPSASPFYYFFGADSSSVITVVMQCNCLHVYPVTTRYLSHSWTNEVGVACVEFGSRQSADISKPTSGTMGVEGNFFR